MNKDNKDITGQQRWIMTIKTLPVKKHELRQSDVTCQQIWIATMYTVLVKKHELRQSRCYWSTNKNYNNKNITGQQTKKRNEDNTGQQTWIKTM